ncbi:MAG: DUF3392 family protein [Kiritimatiellae bacterium]|nr:DUF3392 family protein [Kiritimatiellia bacterium]
MEDPIVAISKWLRPRLLTICTALVATIMILYGNDINRIAKRMVRRLHFFLRVLTLVLICSFGYGMLTVMGGFFVAGIFGRLSDYVLFPVLFVVFMLIGVLAERKRCM